MVDRTRSKTCLLSRSYTTAFVIKCLQDGLIFKRLRVIIPFSLCPEMKTEIHSSHSGIDSCLKRARECLFWPGMTGDIKHFIFTCETYCTYPSANQQETLQPWPYELPSRQWEKVDVGRLVRTRRQSTWPLSIISATSGRSTYWKTPNLPLS